MQRFKVAMGFPDAGDCDVAFLADGNPHGQIRRLWFGLFLVVLSLAAWIWGEFAQRGSKRAGLAMFVSSLLVG